MLREKLSMFLPRLLAEIDKDINHKYNSGDDDNAKGYRREHDYTTSFAHFI